MSGRPRTLAEHLALQERIVIIQTLSVNNYSRKVTAKVLGVTRNHLWRRMRKLGIQVPRTTSGRTHRVNSAT